MRTDLGIIVRGHVDPLHYRFHGLMLEAYPAMNEVMQRLATYPDDEKRAWGRFLILMGAQVMRNGGAAFPRDDEVEVK